MNVNRSQRTETIKKVERVAKGVLVISSLFLILVLVLLTLPKIESKKFVIGLCNVTAIKLITAHDKRLQCNCIKRSSIAKCTIYYPCLQIYVSYNNRSALDAMVVKDRRKIAEKCSYKLRDSECGTTEDVYSHVEGFREQWGLINSSYECYYNSRNPARVILTNNAPNTFLAVALTLISTVGVAIGLVMTYLKERIGMMMLKRVRHRRNEHLASLAQAAATDDEDD